jgi:hypothetical protein
MKKEKNYMYNICYPLQSNFHHTAHTAPDEPSNPVTNFLNLILLKVLRNFGGIFVQLRQISNLSTLFSLI